MREHSPDCVMRGKEGVDLGTVARFHEDEARAVAGEVDALEYLELIAFDIEREQVDLRQSMAVEQQAQRLPDDLDLARLELLGRARGGGVLLFVFWCLHF